MKSKYLLIIGVIVVIIVVAVIILLIGPKTENSNVQENEISEDVVSPENIDIAEEIYGFSAEIKGIEGKTLTLESLIPLANEDEMPVKVMIKAVVDDNTTITKYVFSKESSEDPDKAIDPEEIDLVFDDLKVGDKISTGTNENVSEKIKNQEEINMSYIFVSVVE